MVKKVDSIAVGYEGNATVPVEALVRSEGFQRDLDKVAQIRRAVEPSPARDRYPHGGEFVRGDRVTKISGSKWTGRVVGFYSTNLTPIGYAVESETETGSVQIYPEKALRLAPSKD